MGFDLFLDHVIQGNSIHLALNALCFESVVERIRVQALLLHVLDVLAFVQVTDEHIVRGLDA